MADTKSCIRLNSNNSEKHEAELSIIATASFAINQNKKVPSVEKTEGERS